MRSTGTRAAMLCGRGARCTTHVRSPAVFGTTAFQGGLVMPGFDGTSPGGGNILMTRRDRLGSPSCWYSRRWLPLYSDADSLRPDDVSTHFIIPRTSRQAGSLSNEPMQQTLRAVGQYDPPASRYAITRRSTRVRFPPAILPDRCVTRIPVYGPGTEQSSPNAETSRS